MIPLSPTDLMWLGLIGFGFCTLVVIELLQACPVVIEECEEESEADNTPPEEWVNEH